MLGLRVLLWQSDGLEEKALLPQYLVHGNDGPTSQTDFFVDSLLAFSHLGVNARKFLVRVMSGMSGSDMNRKMPSVAVFFGFGPSSMLPPHDTERLNDLLTDGALIIPVVADTQRFSSCLEITFTNGFPVVDSTICETILP